MELNWRWNTCFFAPVSGIGLVWKNNHIGLLCAPTYLHLMRFFLKVGKWFNWILNCGENHRRWKIKICFKTCGPIIWFLIFLIIQQLGLVFCNVSKVVYSSKERNQYQQTLKLFCSWWKNSEIILTMMKIFLI